MRIMGKRQIGQLQPFELVIAIMIAELASIPMEDVGIPLIKGLVPIFALVFAQVIISYVTLKSERIRAFVCGSPSIIIENGIIQQKELTKQRINLNDLMEQLRSNNIANVDDVEFALLETNGHLSVFPKADKKPATLEDLQIPAKSETLPITLIMDGRIQHQNIKKAGLDIKLLESELQQQGMEAGSVFLAYLDSQQKLKIVSKQGSE